jgi:hypothetical protein
MEFDFEAAVEVRVAVGRDWCRVKLPNVWLRVDDGVDVYLARSSASRIFLQVLLRFGFYANYFCSTAADIRHEADRVRRPRQLTCSSAEYRFVHLIVDHWKDLEPLDGTRSARRDEAIFDRLPLFQAVD